MQPGLYYLHGAISSIVLSLLVLCAHFVQGRTATRMVNILTTGVNPVLRTTALYHEAVDYLRRREIVPSRRSRRMDDGESERHEQLPATGNRAYWTAIIFLIIVIFTCSLGGYFAADGFLHGHHRSLVLGGFYAAYIPMNHNGISVSETGLQNYEAGTVFVGTMAFFSAYIYVVYQIMFRINNNDISPLSYYLYSLHILAACLVAGIFRHAFEWVYSSGSPSTISPPGFHPILAVFAIAIGIKPTLWLENLVALAGTLWNKTVNKIVPGLRLILGKRLSAVDAKSNAQKSEPYFSEPLPLEMIRGMQPGSVSRSSTPDRLREIGVENCQKMATENPFLLWLRTPFGMHTIIDWIAQAQLIAAWPPHRIASLRALGITDIFQYHAFLSQREARDPICKALEVPGDILEVLRSALDETPQFIKLNELREKLAGIGQSAGEGKELPRAAE